MSGNWYEWGLWLLCMLFVGAVVKLLDDSLDADFDKFRGKRTLAARLGRAVFPYGTVLVLFAAYLDVSLTVALFLGSYVVGMFVQWREVLPTRVPAYVEIVVAMAVSVLLTGWQMAFWGISMMAVVDWLDDLVDYAGDKTSGQVNLALQIGVVETLFLVMLALCTAVLLNPLFTALTFIAVSILTILAEVTTKHQWKTNEQDGSVES